jgi:hypothetical protein
VITFPSHTTHLLQPLDVGVFSSFKSHLNRNSTSYKRLSIDLPDDQIISKRHWVAFN